MVDCICSRKHLLRYTLTKYVLVDYCCKFITKVKNMTYCSQTKTKLFLRQQ